MGTLGEGVGLMRMQRRTFLGLAVAGLTGCGFARPDEMTAAAPASPGPAVSQVPATVNRSRELLVVDVRSRKTWHAARPTAGRVPHTPRRLTLHHSGDYVARASMAPGKIRGYQEWHMSLGHPDIDYHYLVDRKGRIYRGRDDRYRGDTQTEYDPTGHFLVCCVGDYQGRQEPTRRQVKAVARLFAYAAQRWDIDPATVGGHRDYAETDCPGGNLARLIRSGRLQRRVRRVMRRRTVQLDIVG